MNLVGFEESITSAAQEIGQLFSPPERDKIRRDGFAGKVSFVNQTFWKRHENAAWALAELDADGADNPLHFLARVIADEKTIVDYPVLTRILCTYIVEKICSLEKQTQLVATWNKFADKQEKEKENKK